MVSSPHPAGERLPRHLTARLVAARFAVPAVIAALAAAQLACGAVTRSGDDSAGATSAPAVDGAVQVDAKLFGFNLSTDTAAAGPISFTVTNDDFLPHDFRLRSNGIDEQTERIQPGDEATLTLDLEPGTYTYLCTVEGHSENMQGTFTVK
jgi:plastocyanin